MLSVRRFKKEDISEVHKLEKLCFSEPWSENSLELLLSGDNFGVVCELDGKTAAYGGMTCVLDEGAVTNIAVAPEYRRQGIGRAVVQAMLAEAEKRGLSSVFLEVRVPIWKVCRESACDHLCCFRGHEEPALLQDFLTPGWIESNHLLWFK